MIDELKKNIETEIEMLKEISEYQKKLSFVKDNERKLLVDAIKSIASAMKIINDGIPKLIEGISEVKKLPGRKQSLDTRQGFEQVNIKGRQINVALNRKDRDRFLKELDISEQLIKKLKQRGYGENEEIKEFKASRGYLKLANRFFFRSASSAAKKGRFKELALSIRRANLDILFESYVAMMYFSVLATFFVSVLVMFFLLFFDASPIWPFFSLGSGSYLSEFGKLFWLPIAAPILAFALIYFYPSTEKKSIGKKIDQELPFAVIHMSAVSGSGIEPSEIFRIIGLSKEYPYLRKEVRKVLNQINIYGYDLTTALNNAAKSAPSEKLAELFSGLSSSITSGAKLSEFFEKRAESLLLSYRLERQKYTKLVETFLDIYISVVIAAPMIFLLLLIMMAISGINIGLSTFQISLISVLVIALLNIVFIVFLHLKQPSY